MMNQWIAQSNCICFIIGFTIRVDAYFTLIPVAILVNQIDVFRTMMLVSVGEYTASRFIEMSSMQIKSLGE